MAEPQNNNPKASVSASATPQESLANHHNNSKKSKILWIVTILILVIGLGWFCYWFFYSQYHEYTDDAYANGNMITINSAIPGGVQAFYVDNTDLVKEGQLLVQLDTTDYQVAYEKELASLANVVLQVRQIYNNVLVSRTTVKNKQTVLSRANFDYENRRHLIKTDAISNEDFVHAKDEHSIAELDVKLAEYQLQTALDLAGNTSIENHPLIEQQKANVRKAYYNLYHCSIYAPATGYIAQRSVEVGQWIDSTVKLMAVIPADYVWVDANFKETQLTYMRIGQPAKVWFDLYGSHVEMEGKVLGIASGTGSVFSIIPPQNATGNWIKIVQRLPVRIGLDPEKVKQYPTRLGISAEVSVNITNQDLPRFALVPPTKPIASTYIFDIHLEKINQIIDKVILENLKKESP